MARRLEEYGLDVLFDPDAVRSRSTQNDTPSTMPTGTQHAERASSYSGFRDLQLQGDALEVERAHAAQE